MALNIDSTGLSNTGLVKNIRNLKVTDLDPLGKGGATFPREIEVQAIDSDGSKIIAVWDGFPNLIVNDFVVCQKDGIDSVMYVAGTSGATSNEGGLKNVSEDPTPQAGGAFDMNAFDLQFDDATGIRDSSDNEQLIFQLIASAITYLEITNAATGNGPGLKSAGETNVDLLIDGNGSGDIILQGTGTGNVGVRTATPSTLEGNVLAGDILHVHSPSSTARVLISGSASAQFLLDDEGNDTDLKMLMFQNSNNRSRYRSMNDDFTVNVDNITVMNHSSGIVGIGTTSVAAKMTIDQSSTTGAIPTLAVDQADISEGAINFIASARGTGSTAASDIQDTVRVELNGTVYRLALYTDA